MFCIKKILKKNYLKTNKQKIFNKPLTIILVNYSCQWVFSIFVY